MQGYPNQQFQYAGATPYFPPGNWPTSPVMVTSPSTTAGAQSQGWPMAVAPSGAPKMVQMPSQQNGAAPWPVAFPMPSGGANPTAYVTPYVMPAPALPQAKVPMPRPKHLTRNNTVPVQQSAPMAQQPPPPLLPASSQAPPTLHHKPHKSALRKGHSAKAGGHSLSAPAVPTANAMPLLTRQRTSSRPPPTGLGLQREPSLVGVPRSRANSTTPGPPEQPDHLFVSFHSANELRIDQINPFRGVQQMIMELVLPMWPYGAEADTSNPTSFVARFVHSPWSTQGPDALMAYRMISRLFNVLAMTGYFYITSVDVAHSVRLSPLTSSSHTFSRCFSFSLPQLRPPRLVFVGSMCDPQAEFFVITFSRSGHKLTLIDPPAAVGDTISLRLRNTFPRQVTNDAVPSPGIHVIEFKRGVFGAPEAEKTVITGFVLKYIKTLGYKLEASVPMARKGMFGLAGRKELWVFKGPPLRRMSIE